MASDANAATVPPIVASKPPASASPASSRLAVRGPADAISRSRAANAASGNPNVDASAGSRSATNAHRAGDTDEQRFALCLGGSLRRLVLFPAEKLFP